MEITAASVVPALATIAAAFVAGGIARSNLIVSKESKISEFRQAWVGELRGNLSSLFSAVRLIARALQDERDKELGNGSHPKFHFSQEKIIELRHSAVERKYNIELLLDAKREHHGELCRLLNAMMDTQTIYLTGGNNADIEPVFDAVGRANEQAAVVLAHEWEMVRKGEDEYRNAVKMTNSVLLVAGVLLAAIIAVAFFSPPTAASKVAAPTQRANQPSQEANSATTAAEASSVAAMPATKPNDASATAKAVVPKRQASQTSPVASNSSKAAGTSSVPSASAVKSSGASAATSGSG